MKLFSGMESKLFSVRKKKFASLVFLLYLVQATSLLWSWHIYTDTYHHPESESRQNEDSKEGTNDDCPICDQLKTLGSSPYAPDPGCSWTEASIDEIFTPQYVNISELNKRPYRGRAPPSC